MIVPITRYTPGNADCCGPLYDATPTSSPSATTSSASSSTIGGCRRSTSSTAPAPSASTAADNNTQCGDWLDDGIRTSENNRTPSATPARPPRRVATSSADSVPVTRAQGRAKRRGSPSDVLTPTAAPVRCHNGSLTPRDCTDITAPPASWRRRGNTSDLGLAEE